MERFTDIIDKDNIDYIKDFYYRLKTDKPTNQFNNNSLHLYWKKIIKKGVLELIQWYYDEIKINNYFDIDSTFVKKLHYINTDQNCHFFYVKIIEHDRDYVHKIQLIDFKRLLSKGFFETAKFILSTDFPHSETFDLDYIAKTIIKYGNEDIVQYAINTDFFQIWKMMKMVNQSNNNDGNEHDDIPSQSSETLIYYLLEPNIKVFDKSIERYENIFFKLVDILDDDEYMQMANDVIKRIGVIISKHLINIFNFVICQYSHMINPEIWVENYILSIFTNNTISLDLIKPYLDKSIISNYTERLHNIHIDTYCVSQDAMNLFYNEFKDLISSYHYFDIIVCDLPIFNPEDDSTNSQFLLNAYPNLYKDNITIDNIIEYYTRYSDWDGNIISYLIEIYPEFNPIDENHNLFKAIREINMNRVHTEEPNDILLQHDILQFLVETYPEHYKSIAVNDSDENSDGLYYLLIDENPYIPIDFNKVLSEFFDKNSLVIIENKHLECLICQDIIDTNNQRIISCCRAGNFDSGHIYCESCLKQWLKEDCRTCPTCRNKLF
jgi:hypothetical protein